MITSNGLTLVHKIFQGYSVFSTKYVYGVDFDYFQ